MLVAVPLAALSAAADIAPAFRAGALFAVLLLSLFISRLALSLAFVRILQPKFFFVPSWVVWYRLFNFCSAFSVGAVLWAFIPRRGVFSGLPVDPRLFDAVFVLLHGSVVLVAMMGLLRAVFTLADWADGESPRAPGPVCRFAPGGIRPRGPEGGVLRLMQVAVAAALLANRRAGRKRVPRSDLTPAGLALSRLLGGGRAASAAGALGCLLLVFYTSASLPDAPVWFSALFGGPFPPAVIAAVGFMLHSLAAADDSDLERHEAALRRPADAEGVLLRAGLPFRELVARLVDRRAAPPGPGSVV